MSKHKSVINKWIKELALDEGVETIGLHLDYNKDCTAEQLAAELAKIRFNNPVDEFSERFNK